MNYPIRINHYLSEKGYCSRREADKLIRQGLVRINGRKARLGDKVDARDTVEINQNIAQKIAHDRAYFAFCKPKGLATQDIAEKYKLARQGGGFKRVFPIGRLDKDSHGLLILTNDGRITDKLLNPDFEHDKEYVVRVDKPLRPFFLRHMEQGINIEGYATRPAKVRKVSDATFQITLTEGKHHQIRRMCAAFDYAVRDLKRVRIMNINLGSLKSGASREIKDEELATFLKNLNI